MTTGSVVWILGAGFSRPLGGPLLQDLISPAYVEAVCNRFPRLKNHARAVAKVYGFDENNYNKWHIPWDNAEEFLEYAEESASDPSGNARNAIAKRIRGLFGDEQDPYLSLAHACRRYLAAASIAFIPKDADVEKAERWSPYLRWAKSLDGHHTIITFNYDTVVERAFATLGHDRLLIEMPGKPLRIEVYSQLNVCPYLLKLHGSSDWLMDEAGISPSDDYEGSYLEVEECLPAIVGPGPDKMVEVGDSGRFSTMWEKATDAITSARAIVFMGYRFPPTDAVAKHRLIQALKASGCAPDIYVVLGPHRNADVIRIDGMIRWAMAEKGILWNQTSDRQTAVEQGRPFLTDVPMWAEDFLTVYDPETLAREGPR